MIKLVQAFLTAAVISEVLEVLHKQISFEYVLDKTSTHSQSRKHSDPTIEIEHLPEPPLVIPNDLRSLPLLPLHFVETYAKNSKMTEPKEQQLIEQKNPPVVVAMAVFVALFLTIGKISAFSANPNLLHSAKKPAILPILTKISAVSRNLNLLHSAKKPAMLPKILSLSANPNLLRLENKPAVLPILTKILAVSANPNLHQLENKLAILLRLMVLVEVDKKHPEQIQATVPEIHHQRLMK
jgi:hypothetical protein